MSTPNQRSQVDLYQLLSEGKPEDSWRPNVKARLERYGRFVKPRDDGFLWCLLRFRGDGLLHSVHRAEDFPNEPDLDLTSILTNDDGYDFQIFVRRCGHGAPLTAGDIDAFNKVWKIPDYLWTLVLQNIQKKSPPWKEEGRDDYGPENYAVLSTQVRSMCIDKNYLYVPDVNSSNVKSGLCILQILTQCSFFAAVIFLCRNGEYWRHEPEWSWIAKIYQSEWSTSVVSAEANRTNLGQIELPLVIRHESHGTVAWLASQALQRRYTTGQDFVFLCAEALLRPQIIRFHKEKVSSWQYDVARISSDPIDSSRAWSRDMKTLTTCQDTIATLPNWIDDLCLATTGDQIVLMKRILRQYRQKIESLERGMIAIKHEIDGAFARTSARMASESISETKFSKILAIVAVVYLPISVASSIFGMNIQQLNGQGVDVIWFVVAIFATFVALVLCWVFFLLVTSLRDVVREDYRQRERILGGARSWKERILFVGLDRERTRYWPARIDGRIQRVFDRLEGSTPSR